MKTDVVIIGAGLTGLTAAYRLAKANIPFLLIDASDTVGGLIQAEEFEGFRLEKGPNTFPSSASEIMSLCEELQLQPMPVSPAAKNRYIYFKNQLIPAPDSPMKGLTTPLLSWTGKMKVIAELWQSPGAGADETVAAFARRRLGHEVLDNLLAPFLSGIYAGDPERLSLPAVFPRLKGWERSSGSILKGLMASKPKGKKSKKMPYQLLSFPKGLSQLTQAIAQEIPQNQLLLSTSVETLRKSSEGYDIVLANGQRIQSKAVLMTVPAWQASHLLADISPEMAQPLAQIHYPHLSVVHLGLERSAIPHPLDGFGFLVPYREDFPLLGCIWSSALFPNRAPAGQALLTCFLGGRLHPEAASWDEKTLLAQTVNALSQVFKTQSLEPTMHRIYRYSQAIPQYELGHLERMTQVENALKKTPGLFLTGNYRKGIALNDCVKQGNQSAQDIRDFLSQPALVCVSP